MAFFDFLDRGNTIAPAGFNRWLFPPAALAFYPSFHLSLLGEYPLRVGLRPGLAFEGALPWFDGCVVGPVPLSKF